MKVGDSVVCDDMKERTQLYSAMFYRGYRVRSEPEGVIGYRVWRIA